MSLLNLWPLPYRLAAVGALLLAAMGYGWISGAEHGEQKLIEYQAAQQKAIDQQVAKAAKTTADLKARADQLEKERRHEVASISRRLNDALGELRNRPARRTDLPQVAAACAGVSGAELASGDAEFLARYAADAAKLRTAIGQCEAQYNEALKVLSQ